MTIKMLNLPPGKCESCAHMRSWSENQAPLGSGRYWPEQFEECGLADQVDQEWNEQWGHELPCPYWARMKTTVCEKHQVEILSGEWCNDCYRKDLEKDRQLAKEAGL